MQDTRRNPGSFLALLKEEQSQNTPGRLKVFFGYAPGVGKTYAMLEAARKLKSENIDVVAGVVESHGRDATQALLSGLEQIPYRAVSYKGNSLKEFDLDAALARKPQIILIDEAAHTNAPGSRHQKRWQDIQELLANGIDVFTTLNTQHIETLNDRVAQITRVEVRERVPDSFVENAFEIELVDLPVDELLQRLKDGKVYIAAQAATALEHFFRKGNLIALREIALLFVAQRVDAQMERYREQHQIGSVWPATDRILVCISPSPLSAKLIRGAKRMASALRADWLVAYVENPSTPPLPDVDKARVIQNLKLAEQLGAQVVELTGESIPEQIIGCAQQFNVSKIVIGKPALPRWKEIIRGSIVDDIIRKSGAIDVYVITGEDGAPAPYAGFKWRRQSAISNYWTAGFVVACSTGIAFLLMPFLSAINLVMIYLLGVLLVSVRYGRGPSILASVLSVAAFDFCFVPPYLTFVVSDSEYILTFATMLTVALLISTLTARVKMQAQSASLREGRTAALYSMSRELASSDDPIKLLNVGIKHIGEVFDSQVATFTPDEEGRLTNIVAGSGNHALDMPEIAVAQWAFHNRQMAGLGTNTLPGSASLYLPLEGSTRMIGVIGILPNTEDKLFRPEQLQLLQTFSTQLAQACERAYLSQENEHAHVQMKTEQLRSSLLSSVSHDLRTPLATITGAASSIIEAPNSLDLNGCKERAEEIYHESVRLNRLVTNLLDMTRLQSGTLTVKKEWHPLDEIIGAALSCMDDKLEERSVKIDISEDALVDVDAILIQQVLVNLLENAIKYTPEGSPIEISAQVKDHVLEVSIADHGPGIPKENRQLIFEKFFREDPKSSFGAGLGLAICNGIIEAHGGKIWVAENAEGGATFYFTVPIDNSAPIFDLERLTE